MTIIDGRRGIFRGGPSFTVEHAGLHLDKMLMWEQGPQGSDEERAKAALRNLYDAATETKMKLPEGYARAFQQRRAHLEKFVGGMEGAVTELRKAKSEGRLVVNLGAAAVRETNIALLHTWGVPYIPGSALKGLASAAAHRSGASVWKKRTDSPREVEVRSDHELLFGDTTESGSVVFHDAWWCPDGGRMPLDLDTMTVHHAEYYATGKSPPADWDEPIPISFLTARGEFLLALTGPPEWVEAAFHWLEEGLKHDGVGAKTAAGYGRMSIEESPAQRAERERLEREAKRLVDARRKLSYEVSRFSGASNARQVLETILEFTSDESLIGDVRAALGQLYERDRSFWRGWLKKKATAEQRAAVTQLGMVPVETTTPLPKPTSKSDPSLRDSSWERGDAWVQRDAKKRPTLFFRSGEVPKPDERNVKDVEFEGDGLEAALHAASPSAPLAVEVSRRGKKIAKVRRAEGELPQQ